MEAAGDSIAEVTTDGSDGATEAFAFLFDDRVRDALVEKAGTSAAQGGIGTVPSDGIRNPLLFLDNLEDERLVGTAGDILAETTAAVGASTVARQIWVHSTK